MESHVHDGHRARVRDRFLHEGLRHFEPHQVLELLLFYAIPRKDTNELAHALLSRFHRLCDVFDAPYEELIKVQGMTHNAAVLLSCCGQLVPRILAERGEAGTLLHTCEDVGRYLLPRFHGYRQEVVMLLSLDNRHRVLDCSVLCEGSVNATAISLRQAVHKALQYNATAAVIAHNHPAGLALPSKADIQTTRQLVETFAQVEIELLDHIIVAEDDFVSMRESPELAPLFVPLRQRHAACAMGDAGPTES